MEKDGAGSSCHWAGNINDNDNENTLFDHNVQIEITMRGAVAGFIRSRLDTDGNGNERSHGRHQYTE